MSSQPFNEDSGRHGFRLNLKNLNVLPSATLPNTFSMTDTELSDMGFQSLSPLLLQPQDCMVDMRRNNDGYAWSHENRIMPLINRGEEFDSRSSSASGKTQHPKICSRGHWKPAEDEKLKALVAQFGPQNWNMIAHHIEGRSGKSCRLRWFNQLDPKINKRAFTEEEEQRLLAAHNLYGNKWATISTLFPGKTDNAVKNHWHVMMARRQREPSSAYTSKEPTMPIFNQSIPHATAFTISNNAAGSSISSNMDDSASTSARSIPMSFISNPIPVQNQHVHGSTMGN